MRRLTKDQREAAAWRVHELTDFVLPRLSTWNYEPCSQHKPDGKVEPSCLHCGVEFRKHQRTAIPWLYFKKRALLADIMGSGKTCVAAGLIAMLRETGEMPTLGRAVIVPRSPALTQWRNQLVRMMPDLDVAIAEGTRRQRISTYLSSWEVLLIGPEMLLRDHELLSRIPRALTISDDIDFLRNPDNKMSTALDYIGRRSDRYVILTGTPFQKRLVEFHAVLDAVGGEEVFGNMDQFMHRYVRSELVETLDRRTGTITRRRAVTGYKNVNELKLKMAPLVLRRTEFHDVTMPTIVPNDVYLGLHPRQRLAYEELQRGVVRLITEEGPKVKRTAALAKLSYGAAICAGLAALGEPDGPGTSVKLDWLIQQLTVGAFQDEKIVVFANLKDTVRAIQGRLARHDVGHVTVWGEDRNRKHRAEAQQRFWDDPECRVLVGTKAIEQSLNLQVSRHLVNVDMILNHSRMEQLAGRIRRDGSRYQHVFVHNLLTAGTQEERYVPMLEREAAVAAHVWDESSQLFAALPPLQLLQLISG